MLPRLVHDTILPTRSIDTIFIIIILLKGVIELLNSKEYELDMSKYIHLNPVEAGMVACLEEYSWSRYRTYLYGEANPHSILSYFPESPLQHYQQYINPLQTDKFYWENGKITKLEREWYPCGLK